MRKSMLVIVAVCAAMMVSGALSAKVRTAKHMGKVLEPYRTDISSMVDKNNDFREVVFTGEKSQLVMMSIPKGGEMGEDNHPVVEQMIFIENGTGKSVLNGDEAKVNDGDVIIVPPGNTHNLINAGSSPLEFYIVYSPANYVPKTVHKTKADSDVDKTDEKFGERVK